MIHFHQSYQDIRGTGHKITQPEIYPHHSTENKCTSTREVPRNITKEKNKCRPKRNLKNYKPKKSHPW